MILIPVVLVLLAPLLMQGLHLARPGFARQWLAAVLSLTLAGAAYLFLHSRLPLHFTLPAWQPEAIFPETPSLLLDTVSWFFSFSVVIVALAVILTAASRLVPPVDWRPWSGTVALAGLSLLAVQAGNPLALLLTWVGLDMVELIMLLMQFTESAVRGRGILAISARLAGVVLLLWALMLARAEGEALNFQGISALVSPYLLMAAGLRLGVIPLQVTFLEALSIRRGLGTALRLLPAASSLMLLVRASAAGVPENLAPFLIALTSIAALYSSLSWMLAPDEVNGRPYWILTVAALAVSAAVRGAPEAALGWSLALLLAGALIFLYLPRHVRLSPFGLMGLFSISCLPFSVSWAGLGIYASPEAGPPIVMLIIGNGVLFVSHIMLMTGYLRHALTLPESTPSLERWVWLVYPLGLALPVLALAGFGWLNRPDLEGLSLIDWLLGLVSLTLSVGFWLLLRRTSWAQQQGKSAEDVNPESSNSLAQTSLDEVSQRFQSAAAKSTAWNTTFWANVLSLSWLYRLAWLFYHVISRVFGWFNGVLEGEGGLVWALVLLVMLLTLFTGGVQGSIR